MESQEVMNAIEQALDSFSPGRGIVRHDHCVEAPRLR